MVSYLKYSRNQPVKSSKSIDQSNRRLQLKENSGPIIVILKTVKDRIFLLLPKIEMKYIRFDFMPLRNQPAETENFTKRFNEISMTDHKIMQVFHVLAETHIGLLDSIRL